MRTPERLEQLLKSGNYALGVMEARLAKAGWLAGDAYSIADIALYAYTHRATLGGYDLSAYPGVSSWLERVASQRGHVPIEWRP